MAESVGVSGAFLAKSNTFTSRGKDASERAVSLPHINDELWQVDIRFGSTVMGGQTFMVSTTPAAGADTTGLATISLWEDPASGGFREWVASSGSVHVLSLVGDNAALAVTASGFQPTTGGSGNEATGSFTLTGMIAVDNVNQALPAN